MRFSNLLIAGMVASSLVAAPAMANPTSASNSASALSVAKATNVKAATSPKKSSKLAAGAVPLVVLGGLAATVAVVAVATDDSDSN